VAVRRKGGERGWDRERWRNRVGIRLHFLQRQRERRDNG
jgi:phage gp46-like protein